jgi:hypothetical protein
MACLKKITFTRWHRLQAIATNVAMHQTRAMVHEWYKKFLAEIK